MTIELIICPHCGYKYRTDIVSFARDGETIAVRPFGFDINKIFTKKKQKTLSIDLKCPSCQKEFLYEVNI